MATNYVYVSQPIAYNSSTGDYEYQDSLRVELDVAEIRLVASLAFADYAGLETEWDAGIATTVLEAAVVTWLGAEGDGDDPASAPVKDLYGDPTS